MEKKLRLFLWEGFCWLVARRRSYKNYRDRKNGKLIFGLPFLVLIFWKSNPALILSTTKIFLTYKG